MQSELESKIKSEFKNPDKRQRPRFRYWWPGATVADHLDELDAEIKSIKDAGFGGIEISDVYDTAPKETWQEIKPETNGFATPKWNKAVKQALKSAAKYGIDVDLTISPHWPATTNERTPDEIGTAKELVYGTHIFKDQVKTGTKIESLCPPHYETSKSQANGQPIQNKLLAVYVADLVKHNEIKMPPAVPWGKPYTVISDDITFKSLTDITKLVKAGKLTQNITTKNDKSILIAIYQRGTGQRVNMFSMCDPKRYDVIAPYGYVVDHFSKEGARLIQHLWEKNILDDEFKKLMKKSGYCFFEDSLELQSVGHWTPTMLADFKRIKGYSLKPYLPFVLGINQDKGLSIKSSSFKVEKEYKQKIEQVRHDYFSVLNDLYLQNHITPLRHWAHSLGMKFRAQPYGWAIDSARMASHLDIPEGESLGFGEDGNDAFRILAAGRDFGGAKIESDEAGAFLGQCYALPLRQILKTLQKNFMAGVNQTYWHGFPFRDAPNAYWPGFSAFSPMLHGRGFAGAWGPRQPVWDYIRPYSTFLARVQGILRLGKNQTDVLLYQTGHNASENTKTKLGDYLTKLGYTYQVMTEGLITEPSKVINQRLVVNGGSYRLVLVDKGSNISQTVNEQFTNWKRQGLPVLTHINHQNLERLVQILGPSPLAKDDKDFYSYHRVLKDSDFRITFNAGEQELSLKELLRDKHVREWNPWTGEVQAVNRTTILPDELRIFEFTKKAPIFTICKEGKAKIQDLSKLNWHLSLESWSMFSPHDLRTQQTRYEIDLKNGLQNWSEITGHENQSGVASYTVGFKSNGQAQYLYLPKVNDSLEVWLNGQKLSGNAFTGYYEIKDVIRKGDNDLKIVTGSTLSNYLNDCPLTNYYGKYKHQVYGLKEAKIITK